MSVIGERGTRREGAGRGREGGRAVGEEKHGGRGTGARNRRGASKRRRERGGKKGMRWGGRARERGKHVCGKEGGGRVGHLFVYLFVKSSHH